MMRDDFSECLMKQSEYRLRNYDRALELAIELENIASHNESAANLEQALYLKGEALEKVGRFVEAKETLLQLEKMILQRKKGDIALLDVYECLGKACYAISELDLALEYWSECLELAMEHQSIEHYIKAYIGVGGVYLYFDLFEESLHHHLLVLRFAEELDDPTLLMMLNLWLGSDYNALGQFEKALHHLSQAKEFYRRRADIGQVCEIMMHMGFSCLGLGDLKKALKLFNESISVAEKNAHAWPLAIANLGVAQVLMAEGRHAESLYYINLAHNFAIENKSFHHEMKACLLRSEVFEALGRFEEALSNYEQYCDFKIKLVSERTKIQLHSTALRKISRSEIRLKLLKTEQQRRNLEKESILQQAQFDAEKSALIAINEAKNEFLALVSHEVRTPLSAVIGMLRLAQRQKELRPNTREQITIGLENAEMLLEIINDLLDASKLEAGKVILEPIPFDLHKLITQVAALFGPRAEDKGLSFIVDIAHLPHEGCLGDPTRIRQILFNLVGNAIKFTEKGSIRLGAYRDGEQIKFSIADTGIGLDEQSLGRLFNKFEQADKSTTRKYGGTGLGLSICRSLITQMQGSIAVTSQLGEGTCFRVDLPLPALQLAEVTEEVAIAPVPIPYQLKVLYAEDILTNQLIVSAQLEEMGLDLQVVETGLAAIEALAKGDFDLVLMDGRMPVMDGLTAARWIRQGAYQQLKVRDAEIYIVALSANGSEDERHAALEAGMNDYLLKPIEPHKLRQVMLNAVAYQKQRGRTLAPLVPGVALEKARLTEADQAFLLQLERGGVAVNEALQRLNGNVERLKRWLQQFFTEHQYFLFEIEQLMLLHDVASLTAKVHGLRGVAGTLGLTALYEAASQLEQDLKTFAKAGGQAPDTARIAQSWSEAASMIWPLLPDCHRAPASGAEVVNPLPAVCLLPAAELRAALESNSLRAQQKLRVLLDLVGDDAAASLQGVAAALDRLDYPAALADLLRILPGASDGQ